MGQVIDFCTARTIHATTSLQAKCRCGRCGADLWTILEDGQVQCADCEQPCPFRLGPVPKLEQ